MPPTADAIDAAADHLHLTAITRLTARLEQETDPIRLERLLAIALRTPRAAPRSQAESVEKKRSASGTSSTPRTAQATTSRQADAPRQDAISPGNTAPFFNLPRTDHPALSSTDDPTERLIARCTKPTPLTDAQLRALTSELGPTEAHRRRLIQTRLADEHLRPHTNSA